MPKLTPQQAIAKAEQKLATPSTKNKNPIHSTDHLPHPALPPHSTPSALTSPESALARLATLYDHKYARPNSGEALLPLHQAAYRLNILRRYAQGHTPQQISIDLNLTLDQVTHHLQYALDSLQEYYQRPTAAHNYIKYATAGLQEIHGLQRLIDALEQDMLTQSHLNQLQHQTYQQQLNQYDPTDTDSQPPPPPDTKPLTGRQATAIIQAKKTKWNIYKDIHNEGLRCGILQDNVPDPTNPFPDTDDTTPDLRDHLMRVVYQLLSLQNNVSDDTARTFTRRQSIQPTRATPLLRMPIHDAYGPIYGLRNWKYRKDSQPHYTGSYTPLPLPPPQQ